MTREKPPLPVLPTERSTERTAPSEHDVAIVAGFHLLQKLGEGGMGEVWEAEQLEPVRRKVALKLIKRGMETKEVVARFESERQALALMSHANIAQVHDAGVTLDGRPYFVMEYVHGVPITRYCDVHRLDTHQRIDLFVQVCDGVQHAHHKGIIHRDLKPSNVLVTTRNGRPVPKIIDFGVAKATAQRLTERTVFTELGQLIGTPEYMSPEQAEMTALDVDTRTDVYSLGVVLYELLVGTQPFDSKELRRAGLDEIRRTIREIDPPRPSTRVTSLGDDSAVAAKNRRTEPAALVRELRGDLDWITMKALEKDRTRRYGSPAELAADLGRHRRHEPVQAGPPSTAYQIKKFVRRHVVGVTATALVLLLLVLGIFGTTVGMVRALRAERTATTEAETTRQVLDFLVGLFEVADPVEGKGGEITARELLDEGAAKLRRDLRGQPQAQARLMNTMGNVYRSLALYEQSRGMLEGALDTRRQLLGPRDPAVAESLTDLARLLLETGDLEDAEALYTEARQIGEEVLGPDHPELAEALDGLANVKTQLEQWEEARALFERALAIRERSLGPDDPKVADSLHNLSRLEFEGEDFDAARAHLERALQIRMEAYGADHPEVAATINGLGAVHSRLGNYDEVRSLFERALTIREIAFGPDHPLVAESLNNVALSLEWTGNREAARPLYRRALSIVEASFGPDDRRAARYLGNLAENLARSGEFREARALFERAVAIREKTLGPEHSYVAASLGNLAIVAMELGDYSEAVRLASRALAISQKRLGPEHHGTVTHLGNLATMHTKRGDHEEAARLYEQALEIYEKKLGPDDSELVWLLKDYGDFLRITGDFEAARSMLDRALRIGEDTLKPRHPNHPDVAATLHALATLLTDTGDFEGAEPLYRRALAIRERVLGAEHPHVAETLEAYAGLLRRLGRGAEADELSARAASIRQGKFAGLESD